MPSFTVTLAYELPAFDAFHGDGPAIPDHHKRPVEWFLSACQRRADPAFTYEGHGDRWSLSFSVDAPDEARAVDDATILSRQIWPNREPIDVLCSPLS